ncbi:molybdopterin biosynthesis protein [Kibdelosporangium philippinense]|uniref:Molybdopterin molybdenumtransferase n=1 Tax=Kibdelosporangium philippinense TaxID=211113 RepID=A0ABS8Z5A3_9PSEU|nr:molybdopterin biosynthesis protein [Kibdelosporangium philippinense]MCE7003083.1 molybdopterin biosynthesis protein [Kibdelosporangium philippinense]
MNSPFVSDVPAAEAHAAWREARAAAGCPARVETIRVPVGEAVGRVTAAPVWAQRSSPAFDSSGMDGIAVRASDTVGASETTPVVVTDFEVVDTGDPLPPGYDAVVMREHVHRTPEGAELRAAVPPYQHVRSIGEDISAAELLLPEGHRLRPVDVAACAAAGVVELTVRRAPTVVIIPTGDEIRPIGSDLKPGEILDTNSLMLAAQAREAGCDARVTDIVMDDPETITAALRAAAEEADLVLLIAGSSAGRDDYTARVVSSAGAVAVHGVAVRPGHPVVLGTAKGDPATPVLGVPGYPVSAALTFDIFAAPLLAELEGAAPRERPSTTARLARKLPSAIGMDDWVRVRLGRVQDQIVATPLPRGAGVLTSLVRADGLLVVPAGVEGHHAGTEVRVELLRGLNEINRTIVAIGSHDLVLDLAASTLRAADPLITLASSNVGSLGGLVALRDGLCHIAGSHLLDPATGEYTLPYVDKLLGDDIAVIRLVHRDQGLIVAPGNPLGIKGIDDLAQVRYVNRQRGAGTRALLDYELNQRGIDPSTIPGYSREEHTHLAVAAAVAAGRADAGLGILAAARAFDLDFVPVAQEPYDLVLRANDLSNPLLAPLWTLLDRTDFRASVEALGGYSCAETGRRIR